MKCALAAAPAPALLLSLYFMHNAQVGRALVIQHIGAALASAAICALVIALSRNPISMGAAQ